MRSRPYTPPPPLPPILSELSTYLPNRGPREDPDVPLSELDPDTSRLLPRKRASIQHHVRIQGRLAPVRSVSVASARSESGAGRRASSPLLLLRDGDDGARFGTGRRRSEYDVGRETEDGDEGVRVRDTQLRGYGIGGAGNIRRATDVIGTSSRRSSLSLSSLFSSSGSTTPSSPDPDKRWRLSGLLDRIEERIGKDKGR